jgi:putative ABC transport system substrate-binding protein
VDRRRFLRTCLVATLVPSASAAESTRVPRIGYLRLNEVRAYDDAFRKGLQDLGYFEGKTIQIEYRYAGGSSERLAELADELVRLRVDVIVAGSTQAVDVARRATSTIPIVFPVTFDPIASGFVESLARPGGNLTGLSPLNTMVTAKRVELIRELIPRVSRVAVLRNPSNSGSAFVLRETEATTKQLGLRRQVLECRRAGDLEEAFRSAVREHANALMVFSDNLFFSQLELIVELGQRYRLPEMFDTSNFVQAGGLMSYGADLRDLYRRSASYVDKILKGSSPKTLPVEQATKFELVVNLKTAKALGLTIPPSRLARADQVIE